MKELNKALQSFWSSFHNGLDTVPAFLSGHVPRGQAYPYITFDVTQAEPIGSTILTAYNWHKLNDMTGIGPANLERADLLDQIAAAIPPEGKVLPAGNGYLAIYRNAADFQTYYDDPQDEKVIGGRTSYEIHFYY